MLSSTYTNCGLEAHNTLLYFRICELIPEAVLKEQFLMPLLTAMVEGLNSEPRVAANICWVCRAMIFTKAFHYM